MTILILINIKHSGILILAQFDTTEDGTLYDPSTGNNFRIFSV